ncbi:MAG: hypothetical protein JSV49_10540 [Thermoplasmata archaeon]|nr:MAG: hypothetical protein JSV49_10540 [Thermoplasmata archaeon]
MRLKSASQNRQLKSNPSTHSDNFGELKKLREAEVAAERKIESAKKTSDKIIAEANKEGSAMVEDILNRIRMELGRQYKEEEKKVKKESEKIISEAKASADSEKSKASSKIPAAVEAIISKILEGG